MKIIFWNIRGMGSAGRRKLLIELIAKYLFARDEKVVHDLYGHYNRNRL